MAKCKELAGRLHNVLGENLSGDAISDWHGGATEFYPSPPRPQTRRLG